MDNFELDISEEDLEQAAIKAEKQVDINEVMPESEDDCDGCKI